MTTQTEALKLAQEGVEIHAPNSPEYIVCAALIETLAQPEQEPRTAEEKLTRMKSELAYMRKSQPEQDCTRSHPHEEMSKECELRTEIARLRNQLAQPEQEPVATLDDLEQEIYENTRQFVSRDVMEWMLKRYYTTPPQRKPLTDEEIGAILEGVNAYGTRLYTFARAIEAVHGIKELK